MPIHELKEQIGRLPEQPGVYLYFNAEGDTIYVGKARALRDRNMMGILEISLYGNLLRSWLALIGVVTVVTLSVAVARRLVMQRFTARPPSPGATPPLLFEGLQKLRLPVVMVVALYGAPHGH